MNMGIQDGINLGWKLAFAGQASDSELLLDSYSLERRPAARRVVGLTHLAFWAEASTGPLASTLRGLVPLVAPALPALLARRWLVARAVRLVSQLGVSYARSPLSLEGEPAPRRGPRPGRRLPDQDVTGRGGTIRLHALLARPGVHVLLEREAEQLDSGMLGPHIEVHHLSSEPGAGLVAVRPDGYVGFRSGTADVLQLRSWLARIGASGTAPTPIPGLSGAPARPRAE
jgi:hypothetical protein